MPFLLFLVYPLAEIAAFILVGEAIGVMATLALVIISSACGYAMLRDAGIMTMLELRRKTANPAAVLADGGTRMLSGLLLLLPGFLTDLAALIVLFPPSRDFLMARVLRSASVGRASPSRARQDVIEGDFRRLDR
jgi:UPF0716 protein FxsA